MPELELKILIGAYAQKFYLGKEMKRNLTETVRNYEEYLRILSRRPPFPLNIGWRRKIHGLKNVVPDLQARS